MGWDDDKSGDYVPKPVPLAVWLPATVILVGFFALLLFAS